MPKAAIYCFDSSSLIHAWRRAYPPKRFSPVWAALDRLVEAGRMKASMEIYRELKKKDDDVYAWAKDRREAIFLEIDDAVQGEVVSLMRA